MITAFSEIGAVLPAEIVTVTDWPGVIVLGVTDAVVPGGSPLAEMVTR
jgi:hypothetical protein